ncbi:hypothetical protein [Streptomyces sp. NBC_01439]|uniref:hypothetical protein n=1 Tax=Streptomyces sp. NBC_01439 TaxID=2903867 RepID=UPI002E2D5975|nr:hypothetical protein [Streptomyces sp. NBC_01439]
MLGIRNNARRIDDKPRMATGVIPCERGGGSLVYVRNIYQSVDRQPSVSVITDEKDKQLKSFKVNLAKGDALEVNLTLGVESPGGVYEVTPELEILKGGKHEFLEIPNTGSPWRVAGSLPLEAPGVSFGSDSRSLPTFPKT